MSEISLYEAQVKKMQGLCDEHNLVYRFIKDSFPVTFIITPANNVKAQMSMLEDVEDVGYRSPDASMMWIFENGILTTKVQGGTFTISKTLRTKIESILIKMINYWQQYFFREIMEKHILTKENMPAIRDDAGDPPEGAEPLESYEEDEDADEESVLPSPEDPKVKEAIRIVRAENAATTSLLQRKMGIGFAESTHILETLEGLGVVGPYNGSQPREVLPCDVPDDDLGGGEEDQT